MVGTGRNARLCPPARQYRLTERICKICTPHARRATAPVPSPQAGDGRAENSATAGAGRDRWRRDHRFLDRVSPRARGLARHRAARARPPHERHDVARGRADGHVWLHLWHIDGAAQVQQRPVLAPGGRDRPGDGIRAHRVHRAGDYRGLPGRVSPCRRLQPPAGHRRARDRARRRRAAVPPMPRR